MEDKTEKMTEIDLGMSNMDHSIDDGFAEALQDSPGMVCGSHSGWDFWGRVWFPLYALYRGAR